MAAERQLQDIRERVTRNVEAAADDLRRLALVEEVDQVAELGNVVRRLSVQLDDALRDLEAVERRQLSMA